MTKPFTEWTVLPHGRLTRLDENILTVTGLLKMPVGDVERRMTAVRLRDGGLVAFSVIALDEPEMRALEAFGTPTFMIVPNEIHRTDARVWKERYPQITAVAPAGAREDVEKVVPVDATEVDFGDPSVRFVTVPGTAGREAALMIQNSSGTTLVLNDLIFNLANRPGLGGWLLKAAGMTGNEPHLPPVVKLLQVKDERALRAQFESWAELPDLRRIVVSHGNIITSEPAPLLRRIAHDLAA
jgi:hypothetical protein